MCPLKSHLPLSECSNCIWWFSTPLSGHVRDFTISLNSHTSKISIEFRPQPSIYSKDHYQTDNCTIHSCNHVSRIRLVLPTAHIRQGKPKLVRLSPCNVLTPRSNDLANISLFYQPSLHPQSRTHPKIQPQYLPPVLPREGC